MTVQDELPRPLKSHFDLQHQSTLYQGPATIDGLGDVQLDVQFDPEPDPTINVAVLFQPLSDRELLPGLGLMTVTMPNGSWIALYVDHVTTSRAGREDSMLQGFIVEQSTVPTAIVALDFQLFNLLHILLPVTLGNNDGAFWLGRLIMEVGDWRLILDNPYPSGPKSRGDRYKRHELTHTGRIERCDLAPFTFEDADRFRHSVGIALSMVTGRSVSPIMATGVDASEAIVHTEWVAPRIDARYSQWALLGRGQTSEFQDLLKLILSLEDIEDTRDVTRYVIGYYLESNGNHMQIELALGASQTAMSMLAWDLFVEQGTVAPKDFKKLSAMDLIRYLLAQASIDKAIPSSLSNLVAYADLSSCQDGPEVITRLRNKVAHPKQPDVSFGQGISVWIEALQLSLSYLQLLILHRFGYRGTYLDRALSRSELDAVRVPWAP